MQEVRLINANELIDKKCSTCSFKEMCATKHSFCNFIANIMGAPTVDAEPVRHGRWEDSPTGNEEYKYCSECGGCMLVSSNKFKFCPFCCAKIDLS